MVQLGEEDSEHDIGCNNLEDLSCRDKQQCKDKLTNVHTKRAAIRKGLKTGTRR